MKKKPPTMEQVLRKRADARKERNNPDYKIRRKKRLKERRETEPVFKIINLGRSRRRRATNTIRDSILAGGPLRSPKGFKALLGCSPEEYKRHIESQFTEGMKWQNHGCGEGKWNIDHIRPLASFDHTDPLWEDQAWHYTNLRPIWAEDNLSKGSEWEGVRHKYGDGKLPLPPERPTLPFED